MDIPVDEAKQIIRESTGPSQVMFAADALVRRLDEIERRARQVRGGLKPYARPVEIVNYIMGEET